MKILIAEDDPFLAKVYRLSFEESGYDVCFATNGEEAIACATKDAPDVILLDILMPKMDGFDVLAKLKDMTGLKDTPVIVLSNLGQDSDIKKAEDLGAVKYMVKGSVDIEDVIEEVKKLAPKKG